MIGIIEGQVPVGSRRSAPTEELPFIKALERQADFASVGRASFSYNVTLPRCTPSFTTLTALSAASAFTRAAALPRLSRQPHDFRKLE